jgi:hypothetical protein
MLRSPPVGPAAACSSGGGGMPIGAMTGVAGPLAQGNELLKCASSERSGGPRLSLACGAAAPSEAKNNHPSCARPL